MQTNDVETTDQVAVLESVVPELEQLSGLLVDQDRAARQSLRDFSVSPALATLEQKLSDSNDSKLEVLQRFARHSTNLDELVKLNEKSLEEIDIFHVLQVGNSELHHSRFLAWLLNPRETHGVCDYFVKSFLHKTCAKAESARLPCMTPSLIDTIDWSGTEVLLERERIDIRVLNREARFVCAIENKVWSPEGIGEDGVSQLHGYRTRLEELFPGYWRHYVFLSPTAMSPRNESDREHWTVESYSTVLEIIEQIVSYNASSVVVC